VIGCHFPTLATAATVLIVLMDDILFRVLVSISPLSFFAVVCRRLALPCRMGSFLGGCLLAG
jgi:hypothetical protein